MEGYAALTEGVPKSLREALQDPKWGEPARAELYTLTNQMRTLVPIRREDAKEAISRGADQVMLFPIYERKIKEGREVFKVRLVCNGKTQYGAGETYSPTPTRIEMYILLQILATFDWEFCHLDETRAFLSSGYKGKVPVIARVKGVPGEWSVRGALYGLKTSPRDYRDEVVRRLTEMGFRRLEKCQCIFVKGRVIVFEFVDDFLLTGPVKDELEVEITEYRKRATTTEPIWDPLEVLGHELERDRENRLIKLRMKKKIEELVQAYGSDNIKKEEVPMGSSQFVVKDDEYGDGESSRELTDAERRRYQSLVGSLLWIGGMRHDIGFSVNYLAGNGRSPRVHHVTVAERVLGYLWATKEVGLELGGDGISLIAYSDSSSGTGKNGRSINGVMVKLNERAGSVMARSFLSKYVRLSSFESELEALNTTIKTVLWVKYLVENLIQAECKSVICGDNEAMINFVKGEATIKSAKHMEIKMYHAKEEYIKGTYELKHVSGVILPADVLTKVCTNERFRDFVGEVQGGGMNMIRIITFGNDNGMNNNNDGAVAADGVSPSSCISAGELGVCRW